MKNGTLTANEVAKAVERGREEMAANTWSDAERDAALESRRQHASILHDEAEETGRHHSNIGDKHAALMHRAVPGSPLAQNHMIAANRNYRKAELLHKEAGKAAEEAGDKAGAEHHAISASALKDMRNELEDKFARGVRR